ncbi:hypothetical protein FKW77_002221 [Venturia effusa]|uniref:Mannosyl-oligosaccharide glucosidase n=1 Tax=Venturia effusa TaxID=50376 RepID=A0A517L8S2_9PEZI|nr:hypothetical protein FKW77_002221 [Venturia effusa]
MKFHYRANPGSLALLSSSFALAESLATDDTLLWGPFRPNLYFGVRSQNPAAPTFGLMWGSSKNGALNRQQLRHACEQGDNLTTYGWTSYDARTGGVEVISDPGNALNLTLEFVKIPHRSEDWSLRVKGVRLNDAENWNATVIFYVGAGEEDYYKNATDIRCSPSSDGAVGCRGDYYTTLPRPNSDSKQSSTVLKSLKIPRDRLWDAESYLLNETNGSTIIAAGENGYGTLHFIERSFDSSFSFDVYSTVKPPNPLSSETLSHYMQNATTEFDRRFNAVFAPSGRSLGQDHTKFSRSLLANLMGGIGYFYGDDLVDISSAPKGSKVLQFRDDDLKRELFTMVPSRSFFPRGFLWDEGFHLLVVMNWDLDLALEILQSWFALVDVDGWLGREQILGPEARSKVPEEFQVQNLTHTNPPTLFLVVETYLDFVTRSKKYNGVPSEHLDSGSARVYIGKLYLGMKRHYEWWRRTQKEGTSYVKTRDHVYHSYRWRGQTETHLLTSGLDDYPRTNPPGLKDIHVDALSWVTLMARVLVKVADYLGATKDLQVFKEHQATCERSLEFLHWSEADQAYCDVTKVHGLDAFECHKGYISLFPLLVGNMNATHPHLNATLALMRDEEELWSPHGLRSLSLSDKSFGTGEDYWRGPIWININYLAIIKLLELSQQPGPHTATARHLYTSLRTNIINTVYNSWRQTGFAWEQYNPITGRGQRTQDFTGWTALVVNILALPDLPTGEDAALTNQGSIGSAGSVGLAGSGGFVEPDVASLPNPVSVEAGRKAGWYFWFGVFIVFIFVFSGLFAFRGWYLKRTGLAGGRAGIGRVGYSGL